MSKARHVLGISGGKDSSALAIYLKTHYPEIDIENYFCDTGEELKETYQFIDNLEVILGKSITRLKAVKDSIKTPFEHFFILNGKYLPSAMARWCTRMMKLKPFEEFVGNDKVISYVAIREDEERDAYISKKSNIQSIFPFRKNIWSQEIINQVLRNENITELKKIYKKNITKNKSHDMLKIITKPLSLSFTQSQKLNTLLSFGIPLFNKIVFGFLQSKDYPISHIKIYPLLKNEEGLNRDDIFRILKDNGIGMPNYYRKIEYTVEEKKGYYARSRSGCYFCFFQQKIEWVWLYEQHPKLFKKAMKFESESNGFTWIQDERLEDLIKTKRIKKIKLKHIRKEIRNQQKKSPYLVDIIAENEEAGCSICNI